MDQQVYDRHDRRPRPRQQDHLRAPLPLPVAGTGALVVCSASLHQTRLSDGPQMGPVWVPIIVYLWSIVGSAETGDDTG